MIYRLGGMARRFLRHFQRGLRNPVSESVAVWLLSLSSWVALLGVAPVSAVAMGPTVEEASTVYHTATGIIVSFDWAPNGQLFYSEKDAYSSWIYKVENGSRTEIKAFSGAGTSVAVVGNYVFFDGLDGNEEAIYKFDVAGGVEGPLVQLQRVRFYAGTGSLLSFNGTKLSYLLVGEGGYFSHSTWQELADFNGQSGPLAVDKSGNLYLAVEDAGIIHRWDAATVSAGIATPGSFSIWGYDLSINFGALSGGYEQISSIAVDENGDIYLALNYKDDVACVLKVTTDGEEEVVLFANNHLGELRFHDGSLFVASGNSILQVSIPEPSSIIVALFGLGIAAAIRRPWRRDSLE